jgi:hypothetical protein
MFLLFFQKKSTLSIGSKMTPNVHGCKFLNAYQCMTAFRRSDAEGLQQIQTLKEEVRNKIFKCLWEVRGSPTKENNPDIEHDYFGRVSMLNEEPRCWSTHEQKAEAVKKYLSEKLSLKFQIERADANSKRDNKKTSIFRWLLPLERL